MQRELSDAFGDESRTDALDRVYFDQIKKRSVAILFKANATNAYVAIYSQ